MVSEALPDPPASARSTTLATRVWPCASAASVPRSRTTRSTREAAMRRSTSVMPPPFTVGRWPSIRTLPAALPKPRTDVPSLRMNPGVRSSMSSAVWGWNGL